MMINMGRNTEYIWKIHDSDALKFCPIGPQFTSSHRHSIAHRQTDQPYFLVCLSVCVLSNIDFIFPSAKILIKIRNMSIDIAILIWTEILFIIARI